MLGLSRIYDLRLYIYGLRFFERHEEPAVYIVGWSDFPTLVIFESHWNVTNHEPSYLD